MRFCKFIGGALAAYLSMACAAVAASPPLLLPEAQVAALANELSGETAKRNLEGLARFHRQRGSEGFHAAAELVAERARAYGLSDVQILQFPADGRTFYGTQRSRQAWDVDEAELSEIRDGREWTIASYAAEPVVLAEDSESAEVEADLVDVGEGSQDNDYAAKDVKGKIVLVSAPAGQVQDLAVGKFGAAGIVSDAQNQKTAWWGENDNLIRWGHLDSFSANQTFAFMVSLRTARGLQRRLGAGERVRLHAHVKAGQHPGFYEIVTAVIPGADRTLKEREIVFSCHLDHQRPGANDNASGCVTILEAARSLHRLIDRGQLPPPARTLRFIWPPEIEGTETLLNAKPDLARRITAVIHMDMVGGGPETKAVFHVTRGPMSLPSFVHDVAWSFARWVNLESYQHAAGGRTAYPLTAPAGGKEPLRAMYSAYTMGSDHDVYQQASFGIPAIYMNDWPDRYIHTNFDTAANIDPTKLKRAALIGAASGYFLANFSPREIPAARRAVAAGKLLRDSLALERGTAASATAEYERGVLQSMQTFDHALPEQRHAGTAGAGSHSRRDDSGDGAVFRRRNEPRGPLAVFGYDYLSDHLRSAGVPIPGLLKYEGAWGAGEEYAYEALNLADGKRSVRQISEVLAAEYGPVGTHLVSEYLRALASIGVLE